MIDYSQYKKTFVDTGVFFTTSGSFTGPIEVLSGAPFIANTTIPLIPTDTFEADVLLSSYLKNRSITDSVSLPYNAEDILFQPNDILNGKLLNDRLEKLKANNTYVYSRLFMADNNLPTSSTVRYAGALSSTDTQLTFFNTFAPTVPLTLNNYFSAIGDAQAFVYSPTQKGGVEDFVLFVINSTEFIALTGNISSIKVVEVSNKIETTENSLTYGDLKDMCIVDNFIFITDAGNGVVYKYDISGYINEDNILTNTRNLVEILGNNTRNTSKPQQITTNGREIVFFDQGTLRLVVYDTNFNFKKRISGVNTRREEIKAIQYSPYFDVLYVLSTGNNGVVLYVYNTTTYQLISTYNIDIQLSEGEAIYGIEFSKAESDFYYIFTNKQIYKLFVSRPDVFVGRFVDQKVFNSVYFAETISSAIVIPGGTEFITYKPSNLWSSVKIRVGSASWFWNSTPTFTNVVDISASVVTSNITTIFSDITNDFKIVSVLDGKDRILYLSNGRVYIFDESNKYKKVLKQSNLISYKLDDVQVNNEEYIQPISINKEFFKIAKDIITLKNNIVGRFLGEYDYKGKVVLQDYSYNLDYNSANIQEVENYFLHNNEKNTLEPFNRCLRNILTLQQQLVEITKVDFGSSLTPVPGISGTDIDNVLIIE